MIPILFAENSTVFTSNGIGRLSDAISCVVREERNGQYELEMVYPESGAHFSEIAIRGIIVAKPSANSSFLCFICEAIIIGTYNGTNNKQFSIFKKSGL